MLIHELMTPDPIAGTPETTIREIAAIMVKNDCGAVPIIGTGRRPVGIVTDRDIVCRAFVAENPALLPASEVMTHNLQTVNVTDRIERAVQIMESKQVHRVLVVDDDDQLVGILSITDLADHLPERQAGELLREVSPAPRRARPNVS